MREYFNCHNHTMYSNIRLLDSINRPKDLVKKAIELGLSGIAITDHECLSSHVEINKIAKEYPDFKIALGNEIYLTDTRDKGQKYYHFILIAKDKEGYKAIKELSSTAWFNSYQDRGERVPTLKSELKEIISKYKGHVIATSACIGGELSTNALAMTEAENVNDMSSAKVFYDRIVSFIEFCLELFGEDFYIECAPSTNKEQILVNKKLAKIAQVYNIKMTVGTDSHYLTKEDRHAHKIYLNSVDGDREVDKFYEFARLMDSDEVIELLSLCFDNDLIDNILNNTIEIQNKIEFYDLFHKQDSPTVEVKDYPKTYWITTNGVGEDNPKYPHLSQMLHDDDVQNRYWVNQCLDKLYELGKIDSDDGEKYLIELEEEARVKSIISKKLETNMFRYPNTLQHYIDLIWECGSTVGAGRGSSCAALNHYLMGITQLDPIEWKLPFFRYLNEERIELGSLILILPSCK